MNRPPHQIPTTNPISLLVTIGSDVHGLHAYLKNISRLHLINYLFDGAQVPEQLRKHGWTVGYRNENPSGYIYSALSCYKTNNSSVFLISIPGNSHFADILLTKERRIFSSILIATSTKNPLSSFIAEFIELQNSKKNQSDWHNSFQEKYYISPRDIQKHANNLMDLETHIRSIFPNERKYVQMNSFPCIAFQLVGDQSVPMPKPLNDISNQQDPWTWFSKHCHQDILFDLRFAFDRISTRNYVLHKRQQNTHNTCIGKSSPLVKFRKSALNASNMDQCKWAILIAVPPAGAFKSVQSTVGTLQILGNIREVFSGMINNNNDLTDGKGDDLNFSISIYASTVSSADHIFCKASDIFENVIKLPTGTTICQSWETLARYAITKGATRLLLSDGVLAIRTVNWISRAEKEFQAGSICVELLGKENYFAQINGSSLISLHVWHVCIFGRLFPHSVYNKEGSFTFLREIWQRTGWFATIYVHVEPEMSQKLSSYGQRFLESDASSFRDIPFETSLSVLRSFKAEVKKSISNKRFKSQFTFDENEFQVLRRLDVIIPTFRLPVEHLRKLVSLRASIPCLVTFWIVVDNPSHPNLSTLLSELDNVTVPHPYTQGHDSELHGLYQTRVLVHPFYCGASVAQNTGLLASLADWAVLLHDDVTPSRDLLDAYLSAISKHDSYNDYFHKHDYSHMSKEPKLCTTFNMRVDILAGITHFPKPHSFWQHALLTSDICKNYGGPVAFPVTANVCIRVRHNPHLFDPKYSNNGGGENIEYGLRVRQGGNRMVVVPDALVLHPWFCNSATASLLHTSKWMLGESLLAEDLSHMHTVIVAPGWAECTILYLPIGMLLTVHESSRIWSLLKSALFIFCNEFLFRSSLICLRAVKQVGFRRTLLVSCFSAILQMSQDVVRVWCHLRRYRADCLFRTLYLNDGKGSAFTLQLLSVMKFIFICLLLLYINLQNLHH